MPTCHQCGREFEIDRAGVATHVSQDGGIDHDLDDDHEPYELIGDRED